MTLKTLIPAAIALALCSPAISVAQDADAAIKALATIAENWQKSSDERWPIVMKCAGGSGDAYEVGFLTIRPDVKIDVQRTTSALNPLVGVITFMGRLETNGYSPRANGFLEARAGAIDQTKKPTCFKTVEDALAATAPEDFGSVNNSMSVNATGYYVLSPAGSLGAPAFYWHPNEGSEDFRDIEKWLNIFPNSNKWHPVLVGRFEG